MSLNISVPWVLLIRVWKTSITVIPPSLSHSCVDVYSRGWEDQNDQMLIIVFKLLIFSNLLHAFVNKKSKTPEKNQCISLLFIITKGCCFVLAPFLYSEFLSSSFSPPKETSLVKGHGRVKPQFFARLSRDDFRRRKVNNYVNGNQPVNVLSDIKFA